MQKERIQQAKEEALRFLHRIADVEKIYSEEYEHVGSSKETGALRRASMDLSRSLSELRKPDWS